MASRTLCLLLIYIGLSAAWMDERPVLESNDGNLFISSAKDRNITLKIIGRGYVNINEINLLHVATAAQSATRLMERLQMGYLTEVENNLQRLNEIVEGPSGLVKRVAGLTGVEGNGTTRSGNTGNNQNSNRDGSGKSGIRGVNERLRKLEDRVRTIVAKLRENECQSNPCQNGGSCVDLYDGYQCHCPSNWEGPNCITDVNECVRLLGTDLGCQNGATCFNLPGSYRCDCTPGWFGLHCTKKTPICNAENSEALCGHGVCVTKTSSRFGYTCICDQGWETNGENPGCTKDVDECAGKHPACSVNPLVTCTNLPGSFTCDSCPHGYTGNGYYCTDIDECQTDNGGCSTNPKVNCINTMGSRICGPCPSGYRGDGISCIYVGNCAINNGGCHPLATCFENPALTSAYVLCRCPPGYVGDGIGPNGCQSGTDLSVNSACASNPCVHGTCVPGNEHTFTCRCNAGYTGTTCNIAANPCLPNPCKNNGVCTMFNGSPTCDCPPSFTGSRCETAQNPCGVILRNPIGQFVFPVKGKTYQTGLSCVWILHTNHSLVLNVTFTNFNLEQSTDCSYDYLQIHDGWNTASQLIGKYCGHELPNGNGNIVSTHNVLYFWFRSDSSISRDGFSFHWNSIEPVCGGVLTDDYGKISSPGSPGRYPPNRDCYWTIEVRPSKRIQFYFDQLLLEEHPTCENDYVEITGLNDERLGIYCNHTRPPVLITPGSEATVHFHSDSSGQDSGFQIHYSTIESIPGCGGIFTTATGIISSPRHTSSYQSNLECEWKIQLPSVERIKITWLEFELEHSTNCRFDYVEIYDGETTDAPLLGRYCGDSLPPTIKSNSNIVLVVFTTDWTFEYGGFRMKYDVICGGEFSEETGILHSPMYPNNYYGSRVCTYEIIEPPGKGIVLQILDLDIEGRSPPDCYFDYLSIHDGDNENSTELATICGDEDNIPSDPFYSTHNFMFLKFSTDGSIEGRGFKANYSTIDRRCGGVFRTPNGLIQSPSEAESYGNEEECIWTIQATPGYVIQLSWMSFSLEYHSRCRYDSVSIYENYTTSESDLLGRYCGGKLPPTMMTQSHTMTVIFRTDSSVTSGGFVASYLFIDASKVCGGHYTKSNGVIRSPNYPEDYPSEKECAWVIEVPNRHKVTLHIKHFTLERQSSCTFDYLEIKNGGYYTSPSIGKYCGVDIPTEITSQTNQMYLKFVSDRTRNYPGFEIEWDSLTEGCGGSMSGISGNIISPNYPEPYMQNVDCNWNVVVAAGSVMQLVLSDMNIENHSQCRFDYVEITQGNDFRTRQRFCGDDYPKIIETKTNKVAIRFRSDFTNSGRGFLLKYNTKCHNKVSGFQGVIESPNFPNSYDNLANCTWVINAPIGNKINISFSHFDLEGSAGANNCYYDYLRIEEGTDDVPNTELGTFCGSQKPPDIHSSQNQVFLKFLSDDYSWFNGFRLEWLVDGCGGHFTRPFDQFTSPGYPSAYPVNIQCEWLIEVDYTHSIELTFHEINTEKRRDCAFDKVQIFGGEDDTAPKLVEICYSDKPVVYTSPGNKMFIRFHSDVSYAGRGFNASYKSVPIMCGGRFTTNVGTIHSTNYPRNYPPRENCEWLLEVDKNHVINFTFVDFDLENSSNCTDDYVQIYDGPTKEYPLLDTLCSNVLPSYYVSTSNEMLIVMRTDTIIAAKGFKAQYSRACGARIIVKDQGYLVPSTGYATDAIHDENCTWIIVAENPADHVTLTFTHMEVDPSQISAMWGETCSWNYIQVIEGEGMDGPSLGKWCANVAPAPITSAGNALTLHLYTQYDFSGHFAATYSVLNSACGGNYTSWHGVISSPGYPNSYPMDAECIWILNTSPGNRISLSFSEFDLQLSDNCDMDYLEIREDSGIGKLISNSCGTSIETITSSSRLWIKFKSDHEGVSKGFLGEYSFLHGGELEGPTGRITSPVYPLPHKQGGTFTWSITVTFGWIVRIEFSDFFIENGGESCYSYLQIYDGYNDEAPLLLEACGPNKPQPIQTSSNIAFIQMKTDFFVSGSWFDLTWYEVPKDVSSPDNVEVKLSKCTEEVGLMGERNNTYNFHSPGWPNGYEHNLECTWIFTSPPGTHLVLKILALNLEETNGCTMDYLAVYSGHVLTSTKDVVPEQRFCLSNSSMSLVKGTNVMTVKFITDVWVNKTGFSAYVYRECGGKLGGPNGIIEMSNTSTVRGIRTWHVICEWTVEVKTGRTIRVTIEDISISRPSTDSCGDNYLMLKNGGEVTSPILGNGKYCGNEPPEPLETTGNRLYVKVVGTRLNARFKLSYSQTEMNCGGEHVLSNNDKEIEITTPNYPNIPPTFAECVWKIMAPSGEKMSIHFIDRFDLSYTPNCEREYVEIRDGGTSMSKSMGRYCRDTAPSTMTTTGNMIYIHFYTDVLEPKNGFKAKVVAGEVCGGIIRGKTGVINSPNYPLMYGKNQTCNWSIIGPTDHTLKISFRDLHLPGYRQCLYTDSVTISEKDPENDTISEIGKYCGLTKPDLIETSSNEAFITFKSDHRDYIFYRGFSLNFTASPEICGGELTAMSGIIKSSSYSHPGSRSRYCDWRIKLPRGFQVVVDILELGIGSSGSSRLGSSLSFYNDFRYKSKIKMLAQNASLEQIRSSGNTMLIGYLSSSEYRGFKLRYSATAPAPCGGILKEQRGVLTGPKTRPFNETSYFCQWSVEPPDTFPNNTEMTFTIKVTGVIGRNEGNQNSRQCFYSQYISIADIGMICGNLTEPKYLRSPRPENTLTILNGTHVKPMNFRLEYEWQPCGGTLEGPRHTITAPKNISYPINCVWYAKYPNTGEMLKLHFAKLNLGGCDKGYIIVRNGGPISPQIGKFCGNIKPYNITSTSDRLWIEYFAAGEPNDFEFTLELANNGCGGALRGSSREISSPQFPKQYPNNAECTWEITADNGYHVSLSFVDRFNLETSDNCRKDYVQIYEWIRNATAGGSWKDLGKVCGRNSPFPFDSNSNRMKVTFHSDETVQGDGFRALWTEKCGGIFQVTDEEQIIQSPAYPNFYPPNLNCNYTLLAPGQDIIVEFLDFQLERGRVDCRFDNLTVELTEQYRSMKETKIWCGESKPPLVRSFDRMEIIFQTDSYAQRNGFLFKYFINKCGGIMRSPGEIKPLMHDGEYFGRLNCTWIIKAPEDKNVVLRFENFVTEQTSRCYFDYVTIYDGETIDSEHLMGTLCGNLSHNLPIFKSQSSSMLVTFISDSSRHYEGFTAKAIFTKNSAAGCGGNINLTATEVKTFRTQIGSTYDSLEDCHWSVTAPPGYNVKFTIDSMDVRNATNNGSRPSSKECNGDYLEIRDGIGPFSELRGRYCGINVPLPILSNTNELWIRFFSDGTVEGSGVTGTLSAVTVQCGLTIRTVNETKHVLTSPNYPNPYDPGTRCRWVLLHSQEYVDRMVIRFVDFNLTDSERCDTEYLQITDKINRKYINQGFGEDFIYSGTASNPLTFDMGTRYPVSSYKYCGSALPHEYYSYGNEVEITFNGEAGRHKGFKLEYGVANCDRNYTSEQGRIVHEGFTDCWITIKAPENHTISLYFNQFQVYDRQQCTESALQVREGNFSGNLLANLCGVETPSPIFSNGNQLSLHSWSVNRGSYENYDITYTTTDKGRGCGGRIFNYGGRFTSPLYPNVYRNDTECTWDVSVPRTFKISLQFTFFDIGTKITCGQNNLKIFDVTPDGEQVLRSTFCGGDTPANFVANSNRVFVKYSSSVNNIGVGWVILFMGQPTSESLNLIDN